MPRIIVSRRDVTREEVSDVLREGLEPRYDVRPGVAIDGTEPANTIVVCSGSGRLFRAQVTISQTGPGTLLRVTPGGLPGTWPGGIMLINRLGIARKITHVLQDAPSLR